MDPCAAVEKRLKCSITEIAEIREHSDRVLSDLISQFEELKSSLYEISNKNPALTVEVIVRDVLNNTKKKLNGLAEHHRGLNRTILKVGESIDRNFFSDFSLTSSINAVEQNRSDQYLNKAIAHHFYREGMDDVADTLLKEAGLPAGDIIGELFADLHRMWKSINDQQLYAALDWVSRHAERLAAINSSLEFKLHGLAFMQILSVGIGSQLEAVTYARKHFPKFAKKFAKDIQKLMGQLIYRPMAIGNAVHRTLISPDLWNEVADTFLRDACYMWGISMDSPLFVVTNAGCAALSTLPNFRQNDLTVEIDLDPVHRYHSIFVCPILHQQSSDDNPPMKLVCGHVISRDALWELSIGNLKCPFCQMEQNSVYAKIIYF